MITTKILERSWSVNEVELPRESLAFLLQYGFKQYLADGAAVSKDDEDGNPKSEEEMLAEKLAGIAKRLSNVESGDFSRTSTRDPFESELRRVVVAALKKAFKAAKDPKKVWPEGKEKRADREALIARALAGPHGDQFRADAADNLAKAAQLASLVEI